MDYDFLLRCKQKKINFSDYDYYVTVMREGGISAQNFIEGKKEVYQIRASYKIEQPPLLVFIVSHVIRHYIGTLFASVLPDSIFKNLRSLRYLSTKSVQ